VSDGSDASDGSDRSDLAIFPQPFSPSGVVGFSMPAASEVSLSVYDVKGRRVRMLATGTRSEGSHQVGWDGTDDAGRDVAPGLYFVRLNAGERVEVKRVVVVR
jgi:flagellar hook assembly protein FlgD